MDELVTIKTYTYAHEAAVARSLLQAEGIFCFLKDELTIQANPFYSNALGGVKLQVRAEEADQATALLARMDKPAGDAPGEVEIVLAKGSQLHECPVCESDEIFVVKKPSGPLFGLSLAFLGFPFATFSSVYHCYGCGRDIKVKEAR